MKPIFTTLLALISCFAVAKAEKNPNDTTIDSSSSLAAPKRTTSDKTLGLVQFKFTHMNSDSENKDSALVIFDRYNRTGAGIVFKVFVQDKDHTIVIPQVPAGKYFVTIQCMGLHHDRVEKIITVHSKKCRSIELPLQYAEEFSKDKVVIPEYKPDLLNLGDVKRK